MLEHTPAVVGQALQGVRAGMDKLVWADEASQGPETVVVTSSAFLDGGALPARSAVLVIEDADSPTPAPIVHALVYDLPPGDRELAAGALPSRGGRGQPLSLGRNSFRKAEYLAPDPPKGHGPHHYVFQIYLLRDLPTLKPAAEKADVIEALRGRVLARGRLIAAYERAA